MSIESVPPHKPRLALMMLLFTIIFGAALVTLLALGLADPPHARQIVWQTDTVEDWPLFPRVSELQLYAASVSLPTPPFTLELNADNRGEPSSAWGFWLGAGEGVQTFLLSNEGYTSISVVDTVHWAQFIHIHPPANKIYLHVSSDGSTTFRINDEIAWTGTLVPTTNWGLVTFEMPHLSQIAITLYASNTR